MEVNNKMVYHPNHYNLDGRKECWDEMIDIFGPEAVAIFDCLSAFKYNYRAGEKEGNPEEQDKEKIKNYIAHADMLNDIFDVLSADLVTVSYAKSVIEKTKAYCGGK